MTRLADLYRLHGQSPWLDNLRRDWLTNGVMEGWIDRGVRGITSNPAIFHSAMTKGHAYDDQFRQLIRSGTSVQDAFWEMAIDDIKQALLLFEPLYQASGGTDGFVSLELAPELANDESRSVDAALQLWNSIGAPNLLIKVPATDAGVSAVRTLVSHGCNINVTLIFGLRRYAEVMGAYLNGLEDRVANGGDDLSGARGVASFFVSRVDTEIDRRLDEIGSDRALTYRGKVAVAQSKLAYQLFRETFSGDRWQALRDRGASVQRPLWASTSTKNPAYSPTLYVDSLIGPDTVNTIPDATLAEFEERGTLADTICEDIPGAMVVMDDLSSFGIDVSDVSSVLEDQGVAAFSKAFDELMVALGTKASEILAGI